MKVCEAMTPDVQFTRPDATLQQAAERMATLDVGSLPVCHEDQLVGMITDRDIVVRSVADGHDPQTDHVADIMTPEVVYCFADQDLAETTQIMQEKQIRRLPVLDRHKRLVGILSLGDVALTAGNEQLAEQALERISEPPAASV